MITVNKLPASNDVNTHGINKFLKWTSEFNGSSGFFLRKNGPLCVLRVEVYMCRSICMWKLEFTCMVYLENTNCHFHVHLVICIDVCEIRYYPIGMA